MSNDYNDPSQPKFWVMEIEEYLESRHGVMSWSKYRVVRSVGRSVAGRTIYDDFIESDALYGTVPLRIQIYNTDDCGKVWVRLVLGHEGNDLFMYFFMHFHGVVNGNPRPEVEELSGPFIGQLLRR
jgi:hypothetical protein